MTQSQLPNACGCFCGACSRVDHGNCSHVNPCSMGSACGCTCAICKRGEHRHCSHIHPCRLKNLTDEEIAALPVPAEPPARALPPPDIIRPPSATPDAREPHPVALSSQTPDALPSEPPTGSRRRTQPFPRSPEDTPLAYVLSNLASLEARLSVFEDEVSLAAASPERGKVLIELSEAVTLCRKMAVDAQELQVKFERVRVKAMLLPSGDA